MRRTIRRSAVSIGWGGMLMICEGEDVEESTDKREGSLLTSSYLGLTQPSRTQERGVSKGS